MCPKDEDRMAKSVDLDQTEEQSDLDLHCPDLSVQNLGTLQ